MTHHPPDIAASRTLHNPLVLKRKNLVRCADTGKLLISVRLWHATNHDCISVYVYQAKDAVYRNRQIESTTKTPYRLDRRVYRRMSLPKDMPRAEQHTAGESLALLAALEIEGGVVFHHDSRYGRGEIK